MSVRPGLPYRKIAKRGWQHRWDVDSDGLEQSYTVAVDSYGYYGCSCPKWRFSKKDETTGKKPPCKHIDEVVVWLHTHDVRLDAVKPDAGAIPPHEPPDNVPRPAHGNKHIADISKMLTDIRAALEAGDYLTVGVLRKKLEAHRGLTSTVTDQIDAAFKQVDQMVVDKFTE